MALIQPGPTAIDPDCNPGGVVIHVYAVPSQKLLTVTHANTGAEAAYLAGRDHDLAIDNLPPDSTGFCLVAFDGDTGERFTAEDWSS